MPKNLSSQVFGEVRVNLSAVFCEISKSAFWRLQALQARKCKKRLKKVFLRGVCREVPKGTRKSLKTSIFGPFWVFRDIFRILLGAFLQTPKTSFYFFSPIPGPERPETPVNGGSGRKFWALSLSLSLFFCHLRSVTLSAP